MDIQTLKKRVDKIQLDISNKKGMLKQLKKQKDDLTNELVSAGVDINDPENWIQIKKDQLANKLQTLEKDIINLESKIND